MTNLELSHGADQRNTDAIVANQIVGKDQFENEFTPEEREILSKVFGRYFKSNSLTLKTSNEPTAQNVKHAAALMCNHPKWINRTEEVMAVVQKLLQAENNQAFSYLYMLAGQKVTDTMRTAVQNVVS